MANNLKMKVDGAPSTADYERARKKLSNLKSEKKKDFGSGSFGLIKTHNVEPIPKRISYSKEAIIKAMVKKKELLKS